MSDLINLDEDLKACMTVEELRKLLKKFNPKAKCIFTWETIFNPLNNEFIYKGNEDILIFDADYNSYRKDNENKCKNPD